MKYTIFKVKLLRLVHIQYLFSALRLRIWSPYVLLQRSLFLFIVSVLNILTMFIKLFR